MFNLSRLAVIAFGTGLLVVACAAPTDPASEEDESASTASEEAALSDDGDDDQAEAEDVGSTSSDLTRERGEVYGADMRNDLQVAPGNRVRPCNRRDMFHCNHRQRGWRWESRRYGHSIGGWNKGQRCCVRSVGLSHPHW